jgi:hypothetical protein
MDLTGGAGQVTHSPDLQIHGMDGEGAKDAAYRAAYRVCMRRDGFSGRRQRRRRRDGEDMISPQHVVQMGPMPMLVLAALMMGLLAETVWRAGGTGC